MKYRMYILLVVLLVVGSPTHVALADGSYNTWADEVLGLRFQYPTAWGFLRGRLDTGDTGYKYYLYARPEKYNDDRGDLIGGGISRDFTEGRGGFYADFTGFRGRPISAVCRGFGARVCVPISYRVAFMVALPKAADLCSGGQVQTPESYMYVGVDLPRNVTVKGFVFGRPLLSPAKNTELMALLGKGSSKCSAENQRAFDAHFTNIYNDILHGTLNGEAGQTYREMRYLAHSVRFWR